MKIELSSIVGILVLQSIIYRINITQAIHIPHESPSHFKPYDFGYNVEDNHGNKQWRQETSANSMEVHGSYGYQDNNGIYREVHYIADKDGYRATVKTNEPSLSSSASPADVRMEPYHSPIMMPMSHHPIIHKSHGYIDHLL